MRALNNSSRRSCSPPAPPLPPLPPSPPLPSPPLSLYYPHPSMLSTPAVSSAAVAASPLSPTCQPCLQVSISSSIACSLPDETCLIASGDAICNSIGQFRCSLYFLGNHCPLLNVSFGVQPLPNSHEMGLASCWHSVWHNIYGVSLPLRQVYFTAAWDHH